MCHNPLMPYPLGTSPIGTTPSKCNIPRLQREKIRMYFHAKSQVFSIKKGKIMPIYQFTYVPHPPGAIPPRLHTPRCHTF